MFDLLWVFEKAVQRVAVVEHKRPRLARSGEKRENESAAIQTQPKLRVTSSARLNRQGWAGVKDLEASVGIALVEKIDR
jgi:hypothetical protein